MRGQRNSLKVPKTISLKILCNSWDSPVRPGAAMKVRWETTLKRREVFEFLRCARPPAVYSVVCRLLLRPPSEWWGTTSVALERTWIPQVPISLSPLSDRPRCPLGWTDRPSVELESQQLSSFLGPPPPVELVGRDPKSYRGLGQIRDREMAGQLQTWGDCYSALALCRGTIEGRGR